MIEKLELLGCSRGVVGIVIPAGYSFNLDGTSIYLSMATLFIAQAYGVSMSVGQQLYIMGVLMLTSKGAAAVTGGGFVTLAATLAATHVLPVEGLALLLGVDRFMSEARAITNLIGNGVATIVVSKMEGEFDDRRYRAAIDGHALDEPGLSVEVLADVGHDAAVAAPNPKVSLKYEVEPSRRSADVAAKKSVAIRRGERRRWQTLGGSDIIGFASSSQCPRHICSCRSRLLCHHASHSH